MYLWQTARPATRKQNLLTLILTIIKLDFINALSAMENTQLIP